MAGTEPARDAKEIELKLAFEPEVAPQIYSHPALKGALATNAGELISTYYDTSDDFLRKSGVFLRVRSTGDAYVQTIKTAKSDSEFLERDEWECRLAESRPDLCKAEGTALAPLLTPAVRAALGPRCHTRIRRTTYLVRQDGAEIEVAVDEGEVAAGTKSSPISEVELELMGGGIEALFALARTISESVPLTLAVKTKAERGFELLDRGDAIAEKARPLVVSPDMSCAEAFRAIGRNCLRQIVVNASGVTRADSEALHQMRVGVRRLRAAIVIFGEMLAGPESAAIKDRLRWIARELGPARDLDVFAADVLEPLRAASPEAPAVETAHRDFERHHAAAYDRAKEAVRSDDLRTTLLDAVSFVEVGDWGQADNAPAHFPVRKLAVAELARLRQTINKKGRRLRGLSEPQRHRLRIRAKRMRYGTEFFAATFDGKKSAQHRKESLAALEKIQNSLGVLNDIVTQRTILAGGAEGAPFARRRRDPDDEKKYLHKAERAFQRFADVKAFWKT